MPEPTEPAAPQLETVAERLARLEQLLATMQAAPPGPVVPLAPGPYPDGLAATPAANGAFVPGAVLRAVLPAMAGAAVDPGGLWGRFPVLSELRLMVRMYYDPHYRLSRLAQFGVPAALAVMAFNFITFYWLIAFPLFPWIGYFVEHIGFALLILVLYKILAREAARYAAVLEYLGRYGR